MLSNNPPPWAMADDLLDAYGRSPSFLTAETAGRAVVLVKQFRIQAEALGEMRQAASEPHRTAVAETEAPYLERLTAMALAQGELVRRLNAYRIGVGATRIDSDYGPKAYVRKFVRYRVTHPDVVPKDFLVTSFDDAAIKKALADGTVIPGVERLPDDEKLIVT